MPSILPNEVAPDPENKDLVDMATQQQLFVDDTGLYKYLNKLKILSLVMQTETIHEHY